MKNAVIAVTTEEEFKIPSLQAQAAVCCATRVLVWLEDLGNATKFQEFSETLVAKLKKCFKASGSFKRKKECMWSSFHQLAITTEYKQEWKEFFRMSFHVNPPISFVQFITDRVFKELVKMEFSIVHPNSSDRTKPLTFEERNALRYVAGYILRKIRMKLETSSLPHKDALILCIMEFSGDEEREWETEAWVNNIDRGGLWHISDITYDLFYAIEEVVRNVYTIDSAMNLPSKDDLIKDIITNDEVLFQWCLVTSSTEGSADEQLASLLKMIIDLYVTIRGFAFASSCLELYKQAKKKTLQKTKPLRSKLAQSDSKQQGEKVEDEKVEP